MWAHIAWTPDGSVSPAIERFQSDMGKSQVFSVIGKASADVVIDSHLHLCETPPTRIDLYDWFQRQCIERYPETMQQERRACEALYHPTHANALPMLQYVKAQIESEDALMAGLSKDRRHGRANKYLLRACFILRLQEKQSEAKWLDAIMKDKFPAIWSKRDSMFYYASRDPKLQGLMKSKRHEPWIPKTEPYTIRRMELSKVSTINGCMKNRMECRKFSTRMRSGCLHTSTKLQQVLFANRGFATFVRCRSATFGPENAKASVSSTQNRANSAHNITAFETGRTRKSDFS